MKRVLITGASGFAGTYLAEHLGAQNKYDIYGTAFGGGNELSATIPQDHIIPINLLDYPAVKKLVEDIRPEWIFHLAALTSPSKSFEKPAETLTNNIEAQVNIFEAALKLSSLPKILIVGSAEEYGLGATDQPVSEDTPLKPFSPYAVSKIAQDYLGLQYFYAHKLPVVRLRPFNHAGRRQPPFFVLPTFAKQIAEIEAGLSEPILKVGNLEPVRDFTDVTDMVKAYELAMDKCVPGEVYNVGSGQGVSIQHLVEMLLESVDISIKVEKDPSRYRPADVKTLIADASKFSRLTNWRPQVPLKDTVLNVLNYWRAEIKKNHQ